MKARRAASLALAGALLLGTAGCTLFASQGTQVRYQPSDGVAATVGDIKLLNVIGLSDNGDDISLLLTIVNAGDDAVSVNFQYEDSSGQKLTGSVEVEAHSSLAIGQGDDLVLRDAGAIVGGLIPIYVQYGAEPGVLLQVPVLDGSTVAYSDLIPEPLPTITETPVPTDSPAPTETPAP